MELFSFICCNATHRYLIESLSGFQNAGTMQYRRLKIFLLKPRSHPTNLLWSFWSTLSRGTSVHGHPFRGSWAMTASLWVWSRENWITSLFPKRKHGRAFGFLRFACKPQTLFSLFSWLNILNLNCCCSSFVCSFNFKILC